MKVAVIGAGSWGTALSLVLHNNGHEVDLWCRSEERALQIEQSRRNPRLPGVELPQGLRAISDMMLLRESQLVVFSAPSFALRETARKTLPYLRPDAVLVSVTKGIEKGTNCRMSEIIAQECPGHPVVALSGPSHAEEVIRGLPTGCVAATPDMALARFTRDVFSNQSFRVYSNPDIVGVELGGALKNVLALCCGINDGLGYGDNTKAMLMTRGLTETARLGVCMGGQKETFAGLSGMGDLIVTCTSMHSRNRRCGILLGQGKSFQQAAEEIGAVVEGYYATESAWGMAQKMQVDMPIVSCMYDVLYNNSDLVETVHGLLGRRRRDEADDTWVTERRGEA